MRLRKEHIERISKLVLKNLLTKDLIQLRVTEAHVLAGISGVILKDMQSEDDLEGEARKLLAKYKPQIEAGELDEYRAILMIKKQLAKERKMVL